MHIQIVLVCSNFFLLDSQQMELTMNTATQSKSSELSNTDSSKMPSRKMLRFKANLFETLAILPGVFAGILALIGFIAIFDTVLRMFGLGSRYGFGLDLGWVYTYLLVLSVLAFVSWRLMKSSRRQLGLIVFYYKTLVGEGVVAEIINENVDKYTIQVKMLVAGKNRAGEYMEENAPIDVVKWRAHQYYVGQPYKFDSSVVD